MLSSSATLVSRPLCTSVAVSPARPPTPSVPPSQLLPSAAAPLPQPSQVPPPSSASALLSPSVAGRSVSLSPPYPLRLVYHLMFLAEPKLRVLAWWGILSPDPPLRGRVRLVVGSVSDCAWSLRSFGRGI
ncbi:hypothetical protein B0H10DRAFT_2211254 [Mycena sp. CBHHK59/15]|nr:hypothetical protein B0H10DRAFT_2211254 [Mycena sp. CBHHK59/15]